MDIFCRDEKLNLSSYYLKPGFAFGGSCLPKDVRALQYRAKEVDLELPVIQSILGSNRLQVQHAIDEIVETGRKRIGLLGFSFKAGTDDLRESPMVILAESLLGKGYQLRSTTRTSPSPAGRREQELHQRADSPPVLAPARLGRRGPAGCGRDRGRKCRAGILRCADPHRARTRLCSISCG